MEIKKGKKEVEEFTIKTKCGKILKDSSEKRLKHNLKIHKSFCEVCKDVK